MKVKTPTGIKVLRVISIAFSVISLLIVASVVYSAYNDYRGISGVLQGTNGQRPVVKTALVGSAEQVWFNVTIPNGGFYALQVSIICDPSLSPNVTCDPSSVQIQPGQSSLLQFHMTINDVTKFPNGNGRINGTVSAELVPFTTISIGVNLASLLNQGGA